MLGGVGGGAFSQNEEPKSNRQEILCKKVVFKGATKLLQKRIFAAATKIGKNLTNNINYCFSKQIYPLTHKTKYLHVEN